MYGHQEHVHVHVRTVDMYNCTCTCTCTYDCVCSISLDVETFNNNMKFFHLRDTCTSCIAGSDNTLLYMYMHMFVS